jgi:hypothetical protein
VIHEGDCYNDWLESSEECQKSVTFE